VSYSLGIDVGTTFVAAAIARNGTAAEMIPLGNEAVVTPPVVGLQGDGAVATGEAAQSCPNGVSGELMGRLGDPTPVILGGAPYDVTAVLGALLRDVVAKVTAAQEESPEHIVLTRPATWGPFRCALLEEAARQAELIKPALVTEPEAAAAYYAASQGWNECDTIAVYDLDGGTFNVTVLRKQAGKGQILGKPERIEHLNEDDGAEPTVTALWRTLKSADVEPDDLNAVLVIGGSAGLPSAAQTVSAQLGRPVVVDPHPQHVVALGAATLAAQSAQLHRPVPTRAVAAAARKRNPAPPAPPPDAPLPIPVQRTAGRLAAEPRQVAAAPTQPAIPPTKPGSAPQQSTTAAKQPAATPQQPTAASRQPAAAPTRPAAVPHQTAAAAPTRPAAAPGQPAAAPGPSAAPHKTTTVQIPAPAPRPPAPPSPPAIRTPQPATNQPQPDSGHNGGRNRRPLSWILAGSGAAVVLIAIIVSVVLGIGTGTGAPAPVSGKSQPNAAVNEVAKIAPQPARPAVGATIGVQPTPTFVAVSPDGRYAYTANRDAQVVTKLDTATNRVTATIPIGAGPPRFLSFAPDGRTLYVSVFNDKQTTHVIDVVNTGSDNVVATIPQPARPYLPEVSPDGKQLYVPDQGNGSISVIDTTTNTVAGEIPVPPTPHGLAFSADGELAFAANHESNLVSVIETRNLELEKTIPVGNSPLSIAINPHRPIAAIVNDASNSVSLMDTSGQQLITTIPVGKNPQDITWSPDGRFAYVVNKGSNTVTVIDSENSQVTATVPTGAGPTSIAMLPNGHRAYVSNLDGGSLTVLELAS
jgi:YVTN family beta-propeller protein